MHTTSIHIERSLSNGRLPGASHQATIASNAIRVRFLQHEDLAALMELEHSVWAPNQAACAADLCERISRHPQLAIGAFCSRTGRVLASLFAKPAYRKAIAQATNWQECVNSVVPIADKPASALFGISLSSLDSRAAKAVFEFFWPYALKNGWCEMFLGSPVPGLRDWVRRNLGKPVEDYIFAKRNGLPCDPQLRYYYQKGFRQIVAVRPNYFPHEASLDYGVVLGGRIPLSFLSPLWQRMSLHQLQAMKEWLFVLR